jgi:cytochrome P450
MDTQTVLDNMVTFLFAGSDTTATVMFNCFRLLAKHPAEQEKLFEEVSAALSLGQHSQLDDIAGCSFLRNVAKETFRLRSSATAVGKVSLEDDVWPHSKQFVPKGTPVQCNFNCVGRYPEIWGDDAAEFRPDRWDDVELESRLEGTGASTFMTFSLGRRSCPGKEFALNEFHLVVATVIRNFKISWVDGEKEPFYVQSPVIQPKFPVNMKVERRDV